MGSIDSSYTTEFVYDEVGGTFCIKTLSKARRYAREAMSLVRIVMAGFLTYQGTQYLVYTIAIEELLLNAVALEFVISLDDVVITEFVKSAGQDTLPTYMLGQLRRSITPEVNAISTMFLLFSVLIVTLFFFASKKRN